MTCHIAAQPSLRCPTVTISHQPRRAQCGGGECCRLQDDLYCFLGKLQESTIARAVTRHGHTHLVCRWSVVLSDALLLSYTFCVVAVLLNSLDINLRLGTLRSIQCFFPCFYGVLVLSATLLVRSVSGLVTRVRTAAVQTRWCLTYIVHTHHLSRCLTLS